MSRHMNTGRKLSRNTSHRRALLDNLVRSVILSESIRTTTAKAKEARRVVEKIITKAREGSLAARRNVHRTVRDQAALAKLFETIAPRFKTRPGGYTRIVHIANRPGEPFVLVERIEGDDITDLSALDWQAPTAPPTWAEVTTRATAIATAQQQRALGSAWVQLRMIRDRWLAQTDYIESYINSDTTFSHLPQTIKDQIDWLKRQVETRKAGRGQSAA